MRTGALCSLLAVLAVGMATAYDPLYYSNRTEVLPMLGAEGRMAFGFFSSKQVWMTDSTGESHLEDLSSALSVIRMSFIGGYGLTRSHTIGVIIPMYLQVSGPSDSIGGGISDPWVTLEGWIERNPQVILRGAVRIPFKGYLETGDYTEGDPHWALDGAVTVDHAASSAFHLQGTLGLRYSFGAWDLVPGTRRDSATTTPPIELRGTGFLVLPVNPELEVRAGLEYSSRGNTESELDGVSEEIEHSSVSALDFRGGFSLDNTQLQLVADVYYRISGENTFKEWGIMIQGLGLDFGSLLGLGSSGR
ncbi:hypothetical protein JW921_00420 [Candidatus Fermentibacterales bacterium]|nr:hypothetical protein [Candidatus Fermentibacterales bacterium]